MWDLFNKKQLKTLKMTMEDVQEHNNALQEALNRANTANRELGETLNSMKNDLDSAYNQIRALAEQVKMHEAQKSATQRFA